MKSDRLLSTLLLLQARGRMTGRELAKRLEVSLRTVHRDMEALGAAGVPVFALRGARGGWQLDEGWRTRVPGLDEAELRALLLAQPRMLGDARLARTAERALDKLMAAMPASMRDQAASMRQKLHVDTTGWGGTPEDLSSLPVVQDAVTRDLRLEIRYRSKGKESAKRVVDPLGLVAKGGTWYLVAGTPDGLRTFRLSRVEETRLLDQPVRRPLGFDLAEYWRASTEELRNRPRYEATLHLERRAADSIRKWRTLTPVEPENAPPPEEGRLCLRVPFDDEDQACFIALGFGSRVDVLGPASLRERVSAEAAAVVERARRRKPTKTPAPPRRRRV